uniref:Anoctamin n=1 Tax=Macrostomum lignano TaxID=282301 RepID=A0A1I8GS17_9PLAT
MKCRQNFHYHLKQAGVEMEKAVRETSTKRLHFLKLYVTWEAMCCHAENLKLRAPLKPMDEIALGTAVPRKAQLFYTCGFSAAKMHNFIGIHNGDSFFSQKQRQLVTYELLSTRLFGNSRRGEIGIDRMINDEFYLCAFPLHEGPYLPGETTRQSCNANCKNNQPETAKQQQQKPELNLRQLLHLHWANWRCWYKFQPLDHVRDYFGEKIAFFFAWLGFYTTWLAPATLVGVFVFVYGLASLPFNAANRDTCKAGKEFKMCPFCDEADGCPFWYLSDICWKLKLAAVFDNYGTVFYAVFMSIWSLIFLEFWKRRTATLAHRWGVSNYRVEISRPRPGFAARCDQHRRNPITGIIEPHFPSTRRLPRIICSYICLLFMLAIVIVFILFVITFQSSVIVYLIRVPALLTTARAVANALGALLHLLLMLALEAHKTQWEFDDQVTMKIFIFEIWNYYSSIFYIAFFKGRFSGYPGHYNSLLGYRPEECDEGGCLLDLTLTLAIIMIGRQALSNCIDLILPRIKIYIQGIRTGFSTTLLNGQKLKPWEADYCLLTAFPLAPLFALLNNILALRIIAKRLIEDTRRPLSLQFQGIGMWSSLLDVIAVVSVISNGFLIAFTSDFLARMLHKIDHSSDTHGFTNFSLAWSPPNTTSQPCRYRNYRDSSGNLTPFYWKLLVVRLSFHLVFSLRRLVLIFIPRVPKKLVERIERQNYLGRQALVDAELRQQVMQQRYNRRSQLLIQNQQQQQQQQTEENQQQERPQQRSMQRLLRSHNRVNSNVSSLSQKAPAAAYQSDAAPRQAPNVAMVQPMRKDAWTQPSPNRAGAAQTPLMSDVSKKLTFSSLKDARRPAVTSAVDEVNSMSSIVLDSQIFEGPSACYFNDGVRRVDYVLVWEEDLVPSPEKKDWFRFANGYRKKFEDNLISAGVELERQVEKDKAMELHRKSRNPLDWINFAFDQDVPNAPLQYYTSPFSASKLKKYVGSENKDTYFKPTQRFEVAYEVLGTQVYGRKDLSEIGLDSMIKRGIYSCAFPPHEGPSKIPADKPARQLNSRQVLHKYWARWSRWHKYQPLEHIREYFGEKVAFYYAFIGHYTTWLVPASVMGVGVFIYGCFTLRDNVIVQETCHSHNEFKMCPLCDDKDSESCKYWYLSDMCGYILISYLFDNHGTLVYSMFASFWACCFLESWKRQSAILASRWDMVDYIEMQERARPEYTSKCTEFAEDPITGLIEPHFSHAKRLPRLLMFLSVCCLLLMLLFRAVVTAAMFKNKLFRSAALSVANTTSASANFLLVLMLEYLCYYVAFGTTEWEMHRTQTEFENQVIIKVFLFELFNYYLSISYTAFFKANIGALVCAQERAEWAELPLALVMRDDVKYSIFCANPQQRKLCLLLHRGSVGFPAEQKNSSKQWEADFALIPYQNGLFWEYLEAVMQFGFVTLFVPAFPLAPLFALINNLVEIRLDARKLVLETRRPRPERAQSIGIWFSMLKFIAYLATIS